VRIGSPHWQKENRSKMALLNNRLHMYARIATERQSRLREDKISKLSSSGKDPVASCRGAHSFSPFSQLHNDHRIDRRGGGYAGYAGSRRSAMQCDIAPLLCLPPISWNRHTMKKGAKKKAVT